MPMTLIQLQEHITHLLQDMPVLKDAVVFVRDELSDASLIEDATVMYRWGLGSERCIILHTDKVLPVFEEPNDTVACQEPSNNDKTEKYDCLICHHNTFRIVKNGSQTGLYCKKCGRWRKWLSKKEVQQFSGMTEITYK